MNRRAYIFYLTIFICGFIVSFFCGYKLGHTGKRATVENQVSEHNAGKVEGYWIISENNRLMVYNYDMSVLIADTEIATSSFSMLEQAILMDGIYMENPSELFKYLEANTS